MTPKPAKASRVWTHAASQHTASTTTEINDAFNYANPEASTPPDVTTSSEKQKASMDIMRLSKLFVSPNAYV